MNFNNTITMKAKYGVYWIPCMLGIFTMASCFITRRNSTPREDNVSFYIAGHRGASGLMPEETIPGMKKGIEVGANVLEFDLYVTKDRKIILHHDPSFNPAFESMPDGSDIPASERDKYTFYKMNYADIRNFIVGGKYYAEFPEQKRIKSYVPLLSEMIDSVEAFTKGNNFPPIYYMPEIECWPSKVGKSNPSAEEFVKVLMQVLKPYMPQIGDRLIIQCFSLKPLQILHQKYPDIYLALLTGNKKLSFEDNIKRLGFKPDFYLPYFPLVTEKLIEKCHAEQVKIIPWTVDDTTEMKNLINMGVDGIITNYPDRLAKIRNKIKPVITIK